MGVPAAWLVACCLAIVASLAQASTVRWVVRVETERDQVTPRVWVVVGDGGCGEVAVDAHLVSVEDCGAEGAVAGVAVVVAVACSVCCAAALVAASAGGEGGAAWGWADAGGATGHGVGPSGWRRPGSAGCPGWIPGPPVVPLPGARVGRDGATGAGDARGTPSPLALRPCPLPPVDSGEHPGGVWLRPGGGGAGRAGRRVPARGWLRRGGCRRRGSATRHGARHAGRRGRR